MTKDLIHDCGAIAGSRINVDHLLPYFLDRTATETYICRLYGLTPEQVAAARAFVLNNPETVLARHLRIEARTAAGNSPDVSQRAQETHDRFMEFKNWLVQRQQNVAEDDVADRDSSIPTFREWFAGHESWPK
jgi:uncharacterized protein (DUF433 family)